MLSSSDDEESSSSCSLCNAVLNFSASSVFCLLVILALDSSWSWINKGLNEWMIEWMKEWINERMNGQMNEWHQPNGWFEKQKSEQKISNK